jgi:DNA-binding protein YbaB
VLDKLKAAGQMAKLKGQYGKVEKTLKSHKVTVEEKGVSVTLTAGLEIEEIVLDDKNQPILTGVLNKAIKKAQKVAAKKSQVVAKDLFKMMGSGF